MTTWNQRLQMYRTPAAGLFSEEFFDRWGETLWSPTCADKKAAAELHTQLATRIATQPLRYGGGVEGAALESIYRLFGSARDIQDKYFGATHFEILSWHVLNVHVRPFTARWHRRNQSGALDALDNTDEFRSELEELRPFLILLDELLLDIRDGRRPPPATEFDRTGERLEREIGQKLVWGIAPTGNSTQRKHAAEINAAERAAIEMRRSVYGIEPTRDYATGLALSGGGIRSATFSLGVLIALARRNILPDFDYLSTVSGGGYLGSFLTTFLSTADESNDLGLMASQRPFLKEDGEAQALRHLRHHSRYLQTSWVERLVMAASQIYGMLINGLALALIPACLALGEYLIRNKVGTWLEDISLFPILACILVGLAFTLPALIGAAPSLRAHADRLLAGVAVPLCLLLVWQALGFLHRHVDLFGEAQRGLTSYKVALFAAAAIPTVCAIAIGLVGGRHRRIQIFLAAIAGCVAPLFVLGVELAMYQWLSDSGPAFASWTWLPAAREYTLAFAILIVYFVVGAPLDINFTSPHRHYRRKLAEAFLIQPSKAAQSEHPFDTGVTIKLSKMNRRARAPYHLLNAALNVPASNSPAMQGRMTDFFLFSRDYCGSPLTGYAKSEDWEKLDQGLDLGTAMAISGAAASPLMGGQTRRYKTFWLALFNVRLGYWIKNPFHFTANASGTPGMRYLLHEMFGRLHEKGKYLNLSDGGHIENLAGC